MSSSVTRARHDHPKGQQKGEVNDALRLQPGQVPITNSKDNADQYLYRIRSSRSTRIPGSQDGLRHPLFLLA